MHWDFFGDRMFGDLFEDAVTSTLTKVEGEIEHVRVHAFGK
jgi:hypothetical protein